MKIKYTNFTDGVHEFDFQEPVEKFNLGKEFFGNMNLHCKMDKSIHQIVLNCNSEVNAHLTCDRCSEDFDSVINTEYLMTYMFSREPRQTDELNLRYITVDTDTLDLDEDAKEFILISKPMKIVCKDDCKGLCPKCGKNLNIEKCDCSTEIINDVWAPLEKLRNKLNN
jgi:uncharacterized protein